MKKLNQHQLRKEADQQTKAIEHLKNWLRNLVVLIVLTAVFAWWGLSGAGVRFGLGVVCVIAAGISVLISAVIVYGIIKGQKNIKNLLKAAEQA